MKELSLHIMDLVQNSIRAKASLIEMTVSESKHKNMLNIGITDNGTGMPKEVLEKVSDPFFTSRTTRNVGLGIPLYKQHVEHCNGNFTISSEEGTGTKLSSVMELNHIDRQPMGDIAGVLVLLFAANPQTQFIYTHQTEFGKYIVDTNEIKEILGNSNVYDPGIIKYLKEMIQENLNDIYINC